VLLAVGGFAWRVAAQNETPANPRSRIPLGQEDLAKGAAEGPAPLLPADLARTAAHASPAIAALYRSLADADPTAEPPYEEMALKRVAEFLNSADVALSPIQRLQACEVVLGAALRFHLGMRDRPLGAGNGLGKRLEERLLEVRLHLLRATAASARRQQDWKDALALAERLQRTYPDEQSLLLEVARLRTAYAGFHLLNRNDAAARQQVEWIEEHFIQEPVFEPLRVLWLYRPGLDTIRRSLRERAAALLREAASLRDDRAAARKLEQALAAWPQLPGLRDAYLRRKNAYTILHVGVRALPEFMSPATACTDAERQAVELLFEGLLKAVYDDGHGQRYLGQLALGPPVVLDDGRRRFHLAHNAFWSDGKRVTSFHVRDTIQANLRLPERPPEWTDLVEAPSVTKESFEIEFKFRQSYFDPLALLTFKVLPQTIKQADDETFARKPVGSGPYQYAGRRFEDGRTFALFAANPLYRRPGHPDGPAIREIRFYVPTDPAREFRDPQRPLHLFLDLPTARLGDLAKAGVKDVRTLRNRRIWFLAVNHRVPALADQSLRRAFALALDRDKILTDRFRGGEPAHRLLGVTGGAMALATMDLRRDVRREFHRPLTGPYPPGSWACAEVPASLHDFPRAQAIAKGTKAKLPMVALTLKYPTDEPGAAAACQDIADQIGRLAASVGWKVQIKPVGLPPRQLRKDLAERQYELAYHHHDYATEGYWLWPLFDSREEALKPGGTNFLGYKDDADLEDLFRNMMRQRDFAEVKKLAHNIQGHLFERMPFIPLWQLDTHIAVHSALRPAHVDPLLVFDAVADWKLEK